MSNSSRHSHSTRDTASSSTRRRSRSPTLDYRHKSDHPSSREYDRNGNRKTTSSRNDRDRDRDRDRDSYDYRSRRRHDRSDRSHSPDIDNPINHRGERYSRRTFDRYGRRSSPEDDEDDEYDRYRRSSSRYDEEQRRQDEEPLTPNINVVLRNLPDKAREVDIQNQLTTMSASVEDVSLIKDRETGESKKFAFVRFTSVGHAIQFVEKYKRFEMDSYFVRVDYCKKGHQRDTAEEWRCNICGKFNPGSRRLCFECKRSYQSEASEKRLQETSTTEINDGTRDISAVPSRFLLLRQLDHLTTEESIYSAVQTLQGVYRTILIRDKLTKMSCEFAFVEFFDVQSASLALDYATQSLTIDGRKVSASFATEESFIPVYGETEWTITSVNPLEGLKAYWDKALYGTEYSKAIEDERRQKEEEQKQAKEREEELKRKEAEAKSKKNTLEDDLNDFYASMGDFDTDSTSKSDIFSVPKSY